MTDVCGECKYCTKTKDEYNCWASPPQAIYTDEDGIVLMRGFEIDPKWPACVLFQRRFDA